MINAPFPHYTWGCIVSVVMFWRERSVPSLYVRVYHGSTSSESLFVQFPHYTWGCIGIGLLLSLQLGVPSLYVRVYRKALAILHKSNGSLTIREGVSLTRLSRRKFLAFPHYTWGCIAPTCALARVYSVPSLYVRVYHLRARCQTHQRCSLIICEGVSLIGMTG